MITLVIKNTHPLSGEDRFGSYNFTNETNIPAGQIVEAIRKLPESFVPSYFNIPSPSIAKNEFTENCGHSAYCSLEETIIVYDPRKPTHGDIAMVMRAIESPTEREKIIQGKLKEAYSVETRYSTQ